MPKSPNHSCQTLEDTPLRNSSHGRHGGHVNVADQLKEIREELEGNVIKAAEGWIEDTFSGTIADVQEITDFLSSTDCYDSNSNRWTGIPESVTAEPVLYQPFVNIISRIITSFSLSSKRSVLDTHSTKLQHIEVDTETFCTVGSSPDILVVAINDANYRDLTITRGQANDGSEYTPSDNPSDSWVPPTMPEARYMQCVAPFEVKLDKNLPLQENRNQAGVYARQCFIQQPNRLFVYVVLVTESNAQLLQFDRSGVLESCPFNIHERADLFVRLVLGVCSLDNLSIGFDTSIFFDKGSRWMTMPTDDGQVPVTYRLVNSFPFFFRRAIRGRGTRCWRAVRQGGDEEIPVTIKDAWRSVGRTPEYELLEEVKGLDGVGQMVHYVPPDKEVKVSVLRGNSKHANHVSEDFRDRAHTRIVLLSYGKTLDKCTDPLEFLHAFHDALVGHKRLWDASLLHRDISINNILLGDPTPPGNRGVLIDLDLAVKLERTSTLHLADFRTGTRAFQSYSVLTSYQTADDSEEPQRFHEYRDDLESFLYVYSWVVIGHENGKPISPWPDVLGDWEQTNPKLASKVKGFFLSSAGRNTDTVKCSRAYGSTFRCLLDKLRMLVDRWVATGSGNTPRVMRDLQGQADKDYEDYLGHVQLAIYEETQRREVARLVTDPTPSTSRSRSNSRAHLKRGTGSQESATSDFVSPQLPVPVLQPSASKARLKRGSGSQEDPSETHKSKRKCTDVHPNEPPPLLRRSSRLGQTSTNC